jgi:hypothetical protein
MNTINVFLEKSLWTVFLSMIYSCVAQIELKIAEVRN